MACRWRCGLVGMAGFEPTTSRSRTERSTKLSHIPTPPYHTRSPHERKDQDAHRDAHLEPRSHPSQSEGPGRLVRAPSTQSEPSDTYLFRRTWQYEQNVSLWHSKHASAPVFFTTLGWYVRQGLFGTAPL